MHIPAVSCHVQAEVKQFKLVFDRFDDNNNGEAQGVSLARQLRQHSSGVQVEVLELADVLRPDKAELAKVEACQLMPVGPRVPRESSHYENASQIFGPHREA